VSARVRDAQGATLVVTEIRHGAGDRPDPSTRRETGSARLEATANPVGPEGRASVAPGSRTWWTGRRKEVVQIAVSSVLLIFIFRYVFRQFADISEVWDAVQMLTWGEIAGLVLATAWSLFTYWIVVVLATPGLTYPQAAVMTQSTTAVANSVPFGGAVAVGLTYAMFTTWGFSKARSTVSVVVTGIWNNFVKLAAPILALALLAFAGRPEQGRIAAAIAGLAGLVGAIVVFALILRSDGFAAKVGTVTGRWASALLRLVGRRPVMGWDSAVVKFRRQVIALVQHRWVPLTLATVLSHASLYLVLVVSLRVMGVTDDDVGWAQVLAVFAFARLVTAIPLTPGGVGVVELALIGGLTRAGGDDAPVVAAVLLFRLLTYVLPIALGLGTYVLWRRNRSWLDSAPPLPWSLEPATAAAAEHR
jgi:uncharacterized protein (TIRG00374 family)